ncbi:hypothetical protein QQF64_012978 [Cirrhinus molitorella]|uniref:Uncharacterized protein n=1 Tax=Cirrhinus molitorella TaxID=172907 RepID=A0ABR3LPV9_9TELE
MGRKKELDDALVTMIVKDLQPFSIVEDEGFQEFVKKLDPTYVLPSRKTVKLMVRQKYQEEKQKAMEHLKNILSVCLTAEMWTSLTMESYLGVTCHYTDGNTELGSVVLGVSKFPKQHTADNIKEALSDVISDWGLTGSVAAMRAIEEQEVLADIRSRARRVVSFFRGSTKATEKLILAQERMGRQPLKLIQEVDTRWNSTHDMLQRFIDLREPVGAALANLSSDIMPLSSADFEIISESLEVLAPFKYATEELSAEKRVSASKIIPIIRMIQHKVAEKTALARNASASSLGTALQKYINKRCSNAESIRVLALATLLDPRFKTLGFGNQDNAREAERLLTGECASIIRLRLLHPQMTCGSDSDATIEVKRYLSDAYLPRNEISVKKGEELKLGVLLSNAYKVVHWTKRSTGRKEDWIRSHGVRRDRMTIRDGNLIINNFTASDAGTYEVLDIEGQILIMVTVTGEQLKLPVLLASADKVETNSSGEWKEVWRRGYGVHSDRMTNADGNLIINEFMDSDAGTYRVLDSDGEVLITVTVTVGENKGKNSKIPLEAVKK